jgi:CHAD domain-containing protein
MAFKFKKKESVAKAVQRLSSGCVEKALECFQKSDQLDGIHSARKEIKKMRALLRMIRREIGEKSYRKRARYLEKAAKHLAAPRDAHVKIQTIETLTDHFKEELSAHSFKKIRAALRRGCRDEAAAFQKQDCEATVKRILRRQPAKFECLPIQGNGWSVIGPALKRSYRAGRKALERAREQPTAENFHDWRKRAKDLWYYVQLLEPIWPEQMSAVSCELEKLGEFLGDDHDLFMLKLAVVKKSTVPALGKEAKTLIDLIESRQQELRAAALALGTRFYAEKPSVFCGRLRQFWKVWRSEPGKRKRSATRALVSSSS